MKNTGKRRTLSHLNDFLSTQNEKIAVMQNVYQAPDFRSPELRQTRNLLYGLLVLNFFIYVTLIPLVIMSGLIVGYFYLGFPMWYYLVEGPLFVNRTRSQAQGWKILQIFSFDFLKNYLFF